MSTTPADFLSGVESQNTFLPLAGGGAAGARELDSPASELSVWLPALASFFDLKNHPLGEAEREELAARNFIHEARVAQQVLRRCLLLGLSAAPEMRARFAAAGEDVSGTESATPDAEHAARGTEPAAAAMLNALADLCALCDALAGAPAVSLSAWESFGGVVSRELSRPGVAAALAPHAHRQFLGASQPELLRLSDRITPEPLAADMLAVFSLLALALERLRLPEAMLLRDRPLKQSLPIFTLVRRHARELTCLIEGRALRASEGRREIHEALDSAAYALDMELHKVYTRELVGLAAARHAPTIYAKVENAFGLLRDCFQQTVIALARLFEPEFDAPLLFTNVRGKLEQSIRLREDLWVLLELVRRSERDRDRRPIAPLVARLKDFQEGNMRLLMFKDWESFERFVSEASAARGAAELGPVLHRFGTYLEALFGQINMRAALADHPFDYPPVAE